MRMRQSIAELEHAFIQETAAEAMQHEELLVEVDQRSRRRQIDKVHKHGSARFGLLVLILLATAVLVTIAMFQTLYYVMG
ncbi:MAG TPA: hypothetical protein VNT22_09950 [Baekduia sp.]|nr:hypothetical protein [Baekduia sp.]